MEAGLRAQGSGIAAQGACLTACLNSRDSHARTPARIQCSSTAWQRGVAPSCRPPELRGGGAPSRELRH
eukprot:COSAG02_NODE_95_length_37416_cov_60.512742_25_plen_69_part_00